MDDPKDSYDDVACSSRMSARATLTAGHNAGHWDLKWRTDPFWGDQVRVKGQLSRLQYVINSRGVHITPSNDWGSGVIDLCVHPFDTSSSEERLLVLASHIRLNEKKFFHRAVVRDIGFIGFFELLWLLGVFGVHGLFIGIPPSLLRFFWSKFRLILRSNREALHT